MPNEKRTEYLRKLDRELYSRQGPRLRRKKRALRSISYGIPTKWGTKPPLKGIRKKKITISSSFFKNFFIFSIIVFFGSLLFAFFMFRGGFTTVSSENIDITILGNAFTPGGEDLQLQIEITNRNSAALEFSDLLLEYPKGSLGETEGDYVRIRRSLGTIGAGETAIESIKIVLFGEQGSVKDVRVALEYRIEGSNAIFVRETSYEITISSAPISLTVEAPKTITSGQEITLEIGAVLNIDRVIEDMRLKVLYPPGFEFKEASPSPALGTNVWDLGDLSPGTEKKISITGTVFGQDGESRTFKVFSGSEDPADPSKIGVVFNSLLHTTIVIRPFIEARITLGGVYRDEYAVASQKEISIEIPWSNNLTSRIDNVEIKVKLSGNALDQTSVQSRRGFYSSALNTITWDKNTDTSFTSIASGQSGAVDFSVSSLPLFSGTQTLLLNPQIVVEVSIKGKESIGGVTKELINIESRTFKIVSDFQIAAKALHYTGPFTNSGTLPPQVNQETEYAILWSVTNSSNRISQALAKTTLPSYVRFTGVISPLSEDVSFDEATREVTWNIGTVPRGTGLTREDLEVAFQVAFLPSLAQVGQKPTLIGETTLTGQDVFADSLIQNKKRSLDTRLSNDPGFNPNDDKVIQ